MSAVPYTNETPLPLGTSLQVRRMNAGGTAEEFAAPASVAPLAHAATHRTGGSDVLVVSAGGTAATGAPSTDTSGGASAVTSGAPSTDTSGGASAVAVTVDPFAAVAALGALAAVGDNVHVQVAGGGALNLVAGFSQPCPGRSIQVTVGVGGVPVVYTLIGTNMSGGPVTLTATAPAAGTYDFLNVADLVAVQSITSVASDVDPVGTTDLELGPGVGLYGPLASIDRVGVDGLAETPTSSSVVWKTVEPASAPDGTRVYTVETTITPTAAGAAHTHSLGAHTHDGPAHTHSLGAHTHAGPSHAHDLS